MATVGRWISAARLVLHEEGTRGVARYAVRRLYLRQSYFLYQRWLTGDERIPFPDALTHVRPATRAERNALIHVREDFGAASYWGTIEPDAECYVGLDGYRIVAVHWLSTREPNNLVECEPGDSIIGPCVTVPTHRGRGVYPAMIRAVCAERRRLGDKRAYMVVSTDNHSSIRGIEKAGFQNLGRADLTRVAGVRHISRCDDPEHRLAS
ncbi:MAG TPA: GNAT family N-acetyltransferase [Candidatus Limnocylindrales bacterium]|nr:GNAT family N-acetyltransferase [Candidatus Limnocylindrales bacterium]